MIWLIILLVITSAAVSYYLGRTHSNTKQEKENSYIREVNNKLQEEYEDKSKKISDINNNIQQLIIDFKSKETEFTIKENELSYKLNEVKDIKFSRINKAATEYRSKLYSEILQEMEVKRIELNKMREKLTLEILQLQVEVDNLKLERDALIKAHLQEEEARLQQDFYKLALSKDSLEDIKLLKSIEKFLYNKDPLYKLIWNTFYLVPTKELLNRIIGKEKTSGIYKITNQINGKIYIGQSVDLHTRLTNHIKAALGITTIAHQLVHDAMAADGLENFTFEIIEVCSKEHLNKKEKLWIETYSSDKYGYNRTAGVVKEDNNG